MSSLFKKETAAKPYYDARKNYKITGATEICFINTEGYWANVAHVQDIWFKDGVEAKVISDGFRNFLIRKDLSEDWLLLYECALLQAFPHSLDVNDKLTYYFAVSQKTGAYLSAKKVNGTDVIKEGAVKIDGVGKLSPKEFAAAFKTVLDDKESETGYIRDITDGYVPLPVGMTSVGKETDYDFKKAVWADVRDFANALSVMFKTKKSLEQKRDFYKKTKAQIVRNHALFAGRD